jgi:hypothetical protein
MIVGVAGHSHEDTGLQLHDCNKTERAHLLHDPIGPSSAAHFSHDIYQPNVYSLFRTERDVVPKMDTCPILPVTIRQLRRDYCKTTTDGSLPVIDNFPRPRLSIVALVMEVEWTEHNREALISANDGSEADRFYCPETTIGLNALRGYNELEPKYMRVIFAYNVRNHNLPWVVVALRWVREFDEICFHVMQAVYFHVCANHSFRNEEKEKRPRLSLDGLKEAVCALVREPNGQKGIDKRTLFREFAPRNSDLAVNQVLGELVAEGRVAAKTDGLYFPL